jgi:hypothetical protein
MDGVYFDPNHGGCLRILERRGETEYVITGAYGTGERARAGTPWRAYVTTHAGHFLLVDFKEKKTRHARIYHALWCPDVQQIAWEDGNVWKRLHSPYDAA